MCSLPSEVPPWGTAWARFEPPPPPRTRRSIRDNPPRPLEPDRKLLSAPHGKEEEGRGLRTGNLEIGVDAGRRIRVLPTDDDDLICPLDPGPGLVLPISGCVLDGPVLDEERRIVILRLADEELLQGGIVVVVEADEDGNLRVCHG